MRVLLVHPQDALLDGPWATQRWDRVVDLGFSGEKVRERAAGQFDCPVETLHSLRHGLADLRRVRDLLAIGLGRLCDQYKLDWWELTAILFHHELELAILFRELARTIDADDQLSLTRPGFEAKALSSVLGRPLDVFPVDARYDRRSARHYLRLAKTFSPAELIGIFWDKTDPGYSIRGRLSARPKPLSHPVVLLPTAYINASRTGVEYASCLPDVQFLLVATRPSGWIEPRTANVTTRWLRSYASGKAGRRKAEQQQLVAKWQGLRSELMNILEFRMLDEAGILADFPQRIARGLEIRDAWRNVLSREQVLSVMCADDSNPYTHMPLLLAGNRGLPTLVCHHGALDGRYTFKRPHADRVLAKGKMEQDYLVRVCGLPSSQVEVGAAQFPVEATMKSASATEERKSCIVLFSEVYEVPGGRAADFYEDTLPPLANLAMATNRELVVKLHPAESAPERKRMLRAVLNADQSRVVRVELGPLEPRLFDSMWFGVTILSTVALECAARRIPCFLCKWLEAWPYDYVDQFTRYGVGIPLNKPEELGLIPEILTKYQASSSVRADCWMPIAPERLRTLLGVQQGTTTS